MIRVIPDFFSPELLVKAQLFAHDHSDWQDGASTAKGRAKSVKQNKQAHPPPDLAADILGEIQTRSEIRNALPIKFSAPLFNCYDVGDSYGEHFDSAIMGGPGLLRTDLSMTIFLTAPEGGELVVGDNTFRPTINHAVLYSTTKLHHVEQVARGTRHAIVLWIQSAVQDEGKRELLRELSETLEEVNAALPGSRTALRLGQLRANLFRRWID